MLQYLDEDQPIKAIDLKDATFMLAKAWDNVSSDTIQKKAGFPGVVVEPTQDPFESDEESVEEGGESSLWRRLDQQYPSLVCISRRRCYHRESNDAERELWRQSNQSRMLALKGTSQTLMMIYQSLNLRP